MPQFNDDLYLGNASAGGAAGPGQPLDTDNSAPMDRGVGPMGRVYVFDVVPVTSGTALLAASQTPGAAGNLTLTAGAGVTSVTLPDGTVELVLDTPRRVTVTAAGANAATFTIFGRDRYGQPMSQAIAAPSTSTVATLKAFKSVNRIAISAAAGSAITAGFNDALGLPVRVLSAPYVATVKWDTALAQDAGTFVAADVTAPATTATGDVRGIYTPSSAANGARRLVMTIAVPGIGSGPNATRVGAFGVTQV